VGLGLSQALAPQYAAARGGLPKRTAAMVLAFVGALAAVDVVEARRG
jgi:hypothetical protein